ncbi:3'(2'),5'-bisphosphate nucleotidase CysQ [Candidatus Endowatersipora endosymbiont of Watersipora subatra]|uniref:3'(2'),5'-bisphosphate nucleotidase CysQ n=1 Tax=Candidatus Endowatersipora endosymbiont of Watersipora subatra TaxID=3077946 RepID=UPI00312C9B6B
MLAADDNHHDLDLLQELGHQAGKIALSYFKNKPQMWMKEGNSPVTEADLAVDLFLKEKLLEARPDYGWLSEETKDNVERLGRKRTFIVDPIDGTRGFINGLSQWCISIAVVMDNRPVVGILECPVLCQSIGAAQKNGAKLDNVALDLSQIDSEIRQRLPKITGPQKFLKSIEKTDPGTFDKIAFIPSLAYRIAMVAMGDLDVAVAKSSAYDWDLAAADLIVHEAGGRLTDIRGAKLHYNCSSIRQGTLVSSAASHHEEMLQLTQQIMNETTESF